MIKMYFMILMIHVIGMEQKIFVSTSNVTLIRNKTSMRNFSKDSNIIEQLRYNFEEIERTISFINYIRRNVKPQPSNMRQLVWSENLAKLAEEWAINCQNKFGPAGCLENITQLIYYEPEENFFRSVTPFFKWSQEMKNYDYYTNRCINGPCENYKKLIGYKSHSIGCSRMKCGTDNIMNFVVCNIYPEVNLRKHLYETGEPCQCDLTENDYCDISCSKSDRNVQEECSRLCVHKQKVPDKILECKTYPNIIDMSNENTEKSRDGIDDSDGAINETNSNINKPNGEIDESHRYIDKLNRNTVMPNSDISKLNGAPNKSNGNIDNIDESYHYTSIYNNKDKNKSNIDIDMDKKNIDIGITDESNSDINKSNDDTEESVKNTDRLNSDINKLDGIIDELNDDTISRKSNSVTDKSNNDTSKLNGNIAESHGDIDKSDGSTDMSSSNRGKLNVVTNEYHDYRVELDDDISNSNKDTDALNGATDGSKSDINKSTKSNDDINKSNSVNDASDGDTNKPNGNIAKSDGSTDMTSSDKSKLNVVTDYYYYIGEYIDDIGNSNKDTDTLNGATDGSKSDIDKSNDDINKLNSVNDETDGDIDKSNDNINKNNDNSNKSSDIMEETSSESSLRSSGISLMKNSQLKIPIFILFLKLLIWSYEEILQIFIMV